MVRQLLILLLFTIAIDIITVSSNKRSIPLNANKRKRKGSEAQASRRGMSSRSQTWPNGVVYYKIDSSLSAHRSKILAAMKQIESKSCVQFKPRTSQSNYVQLFNGDGCYSSVGKIGGRQYLSLGRGCHDVGSAMHEIGHALGFYHEHMRSDRDQFITINWENIESGMQEQFEKVPKAVFPLYTKFDYNSIMIYGTKAFSKNGRNTMTPKVKGAKMIESHFKKSLSKDDVISIKAMYKCRNQ